MNTSEPVKHELWSVEETAAFLKLKPSTLNTWRYKGLVKLPYVRLGHTIRYQKSDVLSFFENSKVHGEGL